ncbi:GAF domain-containing protein [Agromyces aerolatus]|uniref:GAF domain-containing protein n=1 Tax=Agromyces sp. LY-1074 TaxID=3074080 RepID=UPI002857EE08|nr:MULTISPECIES: GAF domain-containing protein [unclassified Agromyces]MDR5699016.1 GAF domain-containing protein [Agromyces sp. LY-1074]MDR5705206.1 GAF domain-containing protein [Agromyces sp. LY-1358]
MAHLERTRPSPGDDARFEALAALATDLAGQFALEPLLERILRHTMELLGCDSGSICTVDEVAGTYRKEVDLGVGCLSGQTFPLDEGVTGAIVRARGSVVFDEYADVSGGHIAARDRASLHGVIGVPIRWGEAIIGSCVVFSREPGRRFTEADVTLVELFATHAAIAITNARLHALVNRREREAAVLAERERVVREVLGLGQAAALHLPPATAAIATRLRWRVLVVHESPLVRAGLVRLLGSLEPGVQVVGEAGDAAQALEAYTLLRPHVVLAHLDLPHIDGLQLTSYLRAADARAAVVLLIHDLDDERVRGAARIGAVAFVEYGADPGELARAVLAAARGESLMSAEVLSRLAAAHGPDELHADHLTPREQQVRALVERGMPDKRIAADLRISVRTVEKHVGAILRKTGAANRTMLASRSASHAHQH